MIVLDTNVVSEMMKSSPDQVVVAWLESQPLEQQHTTVITLAEVRYGIARLPWGRRRHEMSDTADAVFGLSTTASCPWTPSRPRCTGT